MATPLEISELLVAILRHVDMKTLLLAQSVNRRFHLCINDSIRLQQNLFFVAEPDQGQKLEDNALLSVKTTPKSYTGTAPVLMIGQHIRYLRLLDKSSNIAQPLEGETEVLTGCSWERMFLRQPPRPLTHILYQLHMTATRMDAYTLSAPMEQKTGALFEYAVQQSRELRRSQGEAEGEENELAYFQHIQARRRTLHRYRTNIEKAKVEEARLREEIAQATATVLVMEERRLFIEVANSRKVTHGYELSAMPTAALAVLVNRGVNQLRVRARKEAEGMYV
ncbi:hypothetical protein LTR86_001319 [Recurvomyces mirabilis]|nr:hypothetical protein LTR86_001319 [Recurvomyces mirabilis]